MVDKNKIIFVSYGGGHIKSLLPVIKRFIADSNYSVTVLGLTTAVIDLKDEGIDYIGFADFSEFDTEYYAKKILFDISTTSDVVPIRETIAYHGLSFKELIEEKGETEALRLYSEIGRQAFLPIKTLKKIFEAVLPDLVVSTISPRAERAALLAAKELNITSLCLIDLFNTVSIKRAAERGYGTKVAVISQSVKSQLMELGRDDSEVVVTGNPAFDYLVKIRRHKNSGRTKTILWASQVEPALNPFTYEVGDSSLPSKVEDALLRFVEMNNEWRLVIRPHPNEPNQKKFTHPRVIYRPYPEPLAEILQSMDVVVTLTSTVGLEARLLGIPVVTVDMSVFSEYTPFERNNLSVGVRSLNELGNAIVSSQYLLNGKPDGYPELGCFTDNVVSLIEQLVLNRNGNGS
ncbi:hypothetical protein [Neptunomonas sp.]|uniref:hypothetical protein n=1 Tax=Neptunomonas sp. TaxID=1971898 RepID=UPI0035618EAE